MSRAICFGTDAKHMHHAKGCRPGRPLCRVQRRVRSQRRPCHCGAFHFPHRNGSGRCGSAAAMDRFVYGPLKNEAELRDLTHHFDQIERVA